MNKLYFYILILVIGFFTLANNLDKPFYGHHDWNSVQYSNIARNYLRYGYLTTKLGQTTSAGVQSPDQLNYTTHYPPTLPILLSFSFKIFGINETSARLVPLLFSLGSLILLLQIASQLKLSPLASLAATAVTFTPMLRYFGKLPVHEILVVFFSILSVKYYLQFILTSSQKNLTKFLIATVLNGFTSWPGYFLYPFLTLHSYLYHRRLYKKVALCLLAISFTLGLHLLHTYILTGAFFGGGMIKSLLFRLNLSQVVNSSKPDLVQFTWSKYLIQQLRWITVYYTRFLVIVALISTVFIGLKIIKRQSLKLAESLIITLLFFAGSYALVFANMVYIHDYFNIFFLPFFALSFAWIIDKLARFSFKITLSLFLLACLIIATERLDFLKAHQQSNMHLTGYQLGNLINQNVPADQSAIVFSVNYANHHELFIKFYADRKIHYLGDSQAEWDIFVNDLSPQVKHAFVVTSHSHPDLIVDHALATQSAQFIKFQDFHYYQLPKNATIN